MRAMAGATVRAFGAEQTFAALAQASRPHWPDESSAAMTLGLNFLAFAY